ncbi:fluoride efflux transporter CrcB [Piscinibacter koreensis]|uniref:Fluoride-specific ion channel FluC n=1 Tax=Piscinibacter koreensis TaxID=2742824 RepID=A0A7Y6NN46_9BURK|nr:fluoride efflux transporter CrcB [Schlegelella koreensis]NUZ06241.1 fluoride efflux transporter CrcB [Schlegelella koreensis]
MLNGAPLAPQVAAVAGGAAVGALLRWGAALALNGRWTGFPLGTLTVNVIGGLLIGAALAVFERQPNDLLRLLVVTGFLGGFTTFSAFSVESLLMLQRQEWVLALLHTVAHVAGSLACAAIGYRLIRTIVG